MRLQSRERVGSVERLRRTVPRERKVIKAKTGTITSTNYCHKYLKISIMISVLHITNIDELINVNGISEGFSNDLVDPFATLPNFTLADITYNQDSAAITITS